MCFNPLASPQARQHWNEGIMLGLQRFSVLIVAEVLCLFWREQ